MNRRIDIVLAIQSQIAITVHLIFFSFTFFLLDSMRMILQIRSKLLGFVYKSTRIYIDLNNYVTVSYWIP